MIIVKTALAPLPEWLIEPALFARVMGAVLTLKTCELRVQHGGVSLEARQAFAQQRVSHRIGSQYAGA